MDIIDGTDRAKKHLEILDEALERGHFKTLLDRRPFTVEERQKIEAHVDAVRRVLAEGDPMTFVEILRSAGSPEEAITCVT